MSEARILPPFAQVRAGGIAHWLDCSSEKESAMKKLYAGTVLALALLFAPQMASAQNPCGAVCQAYYPCDYACDLCVGDPGLWEEGGGCWGEIVSGTCGDIGQCGWEPPPTCTPEWIYDEVSYQGAKPEFTWDPCEWRVNPQTGGWEQNCNYYEPYKCSVSTVYRISRHQNNCNPSSSQTFCEYGWPQYIGRYATSGDWRCCWDANLWNCTDWFPQC